MFQTLLFCLANMGSMFMKALGKKTVSRVLPRSGKFFPHVQNAAVCGHGFASCYEHNAHSLIGMNDSKHQLA